MRGTDSNDSCETSGDYLVKACNGRRLGLRLGLGGRARLVGLGCVQRTATQDAKLRLCED